MKNEAVKKRLEALSSKLKPANSLVARLDKASWLDREAYCRFQAAMSEWRRQFKDPADQYAAYLDGDEGPKLPRIMQPSDPIIKNSYSLEQAREHYEICCNNK